MGPSCCECFQENQSCFLQMTFHFLRWISKEQSKHILWGNFWVNVRVGSAFDDYERSIFEQITHTHGIGTQSFLFHEQEWILGFLLSNLLNEQLNFSSNTKFDIFDKAHDPYFLAQNHYLNFFFVKRVRTSL